MMQLNHKVKFIELRNYRYIYLIDGIEVDLKEALNETDIINRLYFVNSSLKNKVDFRQSTIGMPLRDFILLGYLFFRKETSDYFVYYIEKLILHCDKKKLTEVLILKYIFNATINKIADTIHSSTDKSNQKYNAKIKEFVCTQILEGKKYLIKKLLSNKDISTISRIIRLITLNSFLQICASEFSEEAIEYFDFIVKEVLLPTNIELSLNRIISAGTGLSKKEAKDIKNIFKSEEKEKLYKNIGNLISKYRSYFYLYKSEIACLQNINEALDNYKKLNEGELATLEPYRVLNICMELFKENFYTYINHISDELIKNNIIINRINMVMEMFSNIDNVKANHIYTYYKTNNTNTMLEDFIIKKFKNQVKNQYDFIINIYDDTWILYCKIKENMRTSTIKFTELSSSILKNQLKQYYKFNIENHYRYKSESDGFPGIITSKHLVIESMKYLQKNFNANSAKDIRLIHVYKLIKYLQNDYKTITNKKITVSTIVKCINELKKFIDWLIETDKQRVYKLLNNPFQYVTFKGVYNKNTDVIPDCVIDKILLNLNELRKDIQRMVLIILNCGMRFKEVAYLEEDCILESTNEYKVLKYIPYKVLEARRRNGLDDYHRIVIDDEIYKEIKEQIDYSRSLREKYNTKEIFLVTGINDNLSTISSTNFCYAVQNLINQYNITDEYGKLWTITSSQYRKTLAVDMITKGNASEHEVSNFLGHLNQDTSKKFYAEVKKKRLADMNSEFFRKKFELSIEEEHLQGFSEEERKSLYVDFCLNVRDVEYGVCIRAFSIDNCNRRGDVFGCTTCSKICTGKKYYKRWMGLYENQKKRVDSLVKKYEAIGIKCEAYENFREFEKERYLLNSFKVVIDKLEGE